MQDPGWAMNPTLSENPALSDENGDPIPAGAGFPTADGDDGVDPFDGAGQATDDAPLVAVDERITRFLCATTHLDSSYADHVADSLDPGSRQAFAPTWEVDPIALARHANLSRSRRLARDRTLQMYLVGLLAVEVVTVVAGLSGNLPVTWVPRLLILWPIVFWFLAFSAVYGHYRSVRDSALAVYRPGRPAASSAPPLARDLEARLAETHRANTVVFRGYVPFASSGYTLDTWRLSLDLEAARAKATSAHPVTSFTAHELQDHLMAGALPLDLPGVTVQRRLYVDGGTAGGVAGLVPRPPFPARRPESILPEELLWQYTQQPNRTARTYCCFTRSAWNGDIVVTLFVRAEVTRSMLFVEGRSHVLLPVQAGFKDVAWVSEKADAGWWGPTASAAASATTGLYLESVVRGIARWRANRAGAKASKEEGEAIELGHPVHYGSPITSLREECSVTSDLAYYGSVDEVMAFKTMTRNVLMRLTDFLGARGLAGEDFEEQRAIIASKTFHISGIQGAAVAGSDSPAKGTPSG